MHEIVKGIYTWSRLSEPNGYDFSGFLVLHSEGNLCIDPVAPDRSTLERIVEIGVDRIVLTNRNHVRAAHAVREAVGGARVAIHPDDADRARDQGTSVDEELRAGEMVGPFVVVAVPGKSPGEVALFWPERRLLVVGDAVIGNPPGKLTLLPDEKLDDPRLLRASVRRLLLFDFDQLLAADGASILESAKDPLRALVASFPD